MARERHRRRSVARGCWVNDAPTVGFVLGGGGLLGAAEVGMLRAFFERQRRPDLVVGTSVGALHGAMIAAEPTIASVDKLEAAWRELLELGMLSASWLTGAAGLLRTRTHVRSNAPSPPRRRTAPGRNIRAARDPVSVRRRLHRALLGALVQHRSGRRRDPRLRRRSWTAAAGRDPRRALHRRRRREQHPDRPGRQARCEGDLRLAPGPDRPAARAPKRLRDVGLVALEIARRHRFVRDLESVPAGVTVHVLPTGDPDQPRYDDLSRYRYRGFPRVERRIGLASARRH
jgi:NTE family protein